MARNGFLLNNSQTGTLALGASAAIQGAIDAFEGLSEQVLAAAQAYAPWDDRTGMARDRLWVEVYEDNGSIYLDLGHGVDYGLYLETIQNGRFATIMPTLETYAGILFAEAGGRVTSIEPVEGYETFEEYS